uniref:Putative secreted protein n=1 Tax=Ixodes ricinus TaxID=34613 RepID=A0A6B0UBU2_IXORI
MLWKLCSLLPATLNSIRSQSSAKTNRSMMRGAASKESSQVLWTTMVLWPPSMISLVYSSMARLLSPTYGTYLITTQ